MDKAYHAYIITNTLLCMYIQYMYMCGGGGVDKHSYIYMQQLLNRTMKSSIHSYEVIYGVSLLVVVILYSKLIAD